MDLAKELADSKHFGQLAEDLVVSRQQIVPDERGLLLVAYWSLGFDYHKAVVLLIERHFYGAAFTLMRPMLEATIRAHLCLSVSEDGIRKLQKDDYRVDFKTVGKQIDDAFGLGGFLDNLLKSSKDVLHSYTHAGLSQLGRRFKGNDLIPDYSDDEIIEVIRSATSMTFMLNNLVTKHFGFEEEWQKNNALFGEYGKHC